MTLKPNEEDGRVVRFAESRPDLPRENPFRSLFSGVSRRARLKYLQDGVRYWAGVAKLMGDMHTVQDALQEHTIRQGLRPQLQRSETERQLDKIEEDRHQRSLTAKRRAQEALRADTEVLQARQTLNAKEKFEPLKHAMGEERLKAEAARRKVGAAEAFAAMAEAGHPQEPSAPASSEAPKPPRAVVISEMLERIRQELRELRADDGDPARRSQLVADEAALERMLAALLSE